MKKFSINLLKVGLLLIIGLCVISISDEVNAVGDIEGIKLQKKSGYVDDYINLQGTYFVNRGYLQETIHNLESVPYVDDAKLATSTALTGNGKIIDAEQCGIGTGSAGPFYFKYNDHDTKGVACYVVDLRLGLKNPGVNATEHKGSYDKDWGYQGAFIYEYNLTNVKESNEMTLRYNGTNTVSGSSIKSNLIDKKGIGKIFGVDESYMDDNKTEVSYTVDYIRNDKSVDIAKENNISKYVKVDNAARITIDKEQLETYFKSNTGVKFITARVSLNVKVVANTSGLGNNAYHYVPENRDAAITSNVKTGFFIRIKNPHYNVKPAASTTINIEKSEDQLMNGIKTMILSVKDSSGKNVTWSITSGDTLAELSATNGQSVTLTAKDNKKGSVKIKAEANGVSDEIQIYVNTKTTTGKDNDKDNDNKNIPAEPTTPKYSDGTTLAKDDYMKYVNGTSNSKNDTWNLRKDKNLNGTVLGEIGTDDIIQITEAQTNSLWVKVKVVKAVDGTKNGTDPVAENEEGYIYFNDNAKKGFSKTTFTETVVSGDKVDVDGSVTEGFDFSGFNFDTEGIMNLVMSIINGLLKTIMSLIGDINWSGVAESTGSIISNLITTVISK